MEVLKVHISVRAMRDVREGFNKAGVQFLGTVINLIQIGMTSN